MRKIESNELKKVELDILKDVAKFCDKNNIRYFLAGGTLLGAVRHKGFIPWDDDIDIIMPRPDYEKFELMYPAKNKSGYKLMSLNINENYTCAFIKVFDPETILTNNVVKNYGHYGVYIDIFPMDGLPGDINKSNGHFRKQQLLNKISWQSNSKLFRKRKNLFKNIVGPFSNLICRICVKLIGRKRFIGFIEARSKQWNFETSEFVGVSVFGYGNKERIKRSNYAEQIDVEFENEIFKAPKGYHEYLTNLYGDYMTLPPVEKQKTHHNFDAYWKD